MTDKFLLTSKMPQTSPRCSTSICWALVSLECSLVFSSWKSPSCKVKTMCFYMGLVSLRYPTAFGYLSLFPSRSSTGTQNPSVFAQETKIPFSMERTNASSKPAKFLLLESILICRFVLSLGSLLEFHSLKLDIDELSCITCSILYFFHFVNWLHFPKYNIINYIKFNYSSAQILLCFN